MNITKKDILEALAASANWRENGPRVNDLLLDMLLKLDKDQ